MSQSLRSNPVGFCLSSRWFKISHWGFLTYGLTLPGGSEDKVSACNEGDPGLIPGLGRSPEEGNGNPLQYSFLENPMDRGAWWATVHGSQRVGHDWVTSLTYLWFMCFKLLFFNCFKIESVCSQALYSKFSVLCSATVFLNIFAIGFQSWCFRDLSLLEQDARGECLDGAHPSGKISIPLWSFLIVDNHSWGMVLFLA